MFSISHSLSKRVAVLSTSDFAVSLPDIRVSATTVRTQSFHVTMVEETLEQQLTLGHKMKAPLPLSPLSLHIRTFCERNNEDRQYSEHSSTFDQVFDHLSYDI